MGKKIRASLVILALILAVPLSVRAEGRFNKFSVKVKGEITNMITEDLDSDGLFEVMVLHRDTKADPILRFLTVFWQSGDKGFNDEARTTWTIPREVAAVDVGDVKPDRGRELVFITEKGVSWAPAARSGIGSLVEMFTVQSVVAIASDRHVPYYNFVRDYTGDGKDDILVCGFDGTLVAVQESGYRFSTKKINLKPDIEIFAFDIKELMQSPENPFFRVAYSVPQVFSEDYDADGLNDLLVSFRSKVLIFAQDNNGFSADPVRSYKIDLIEEEDTRMRRHQPPNVEFGDIDQDGKVDVVVHQAINKPGRMESRNVLFWGRSRNIEKGVPDIEFITENTALAGAFITDANGDGLLDIMMPTHPMSIWSAVPILVTQEISVDWAYFIQKPDHTFSPSPDRVTTTDLKFNMRKVRLESGIPNVVGDFNGDGLPDQVLGEEENILGITLRDRDGNAMDPKEKVEIPVSIFNRVVDLNADGLSDIVIFYFEQPELMGVLNVLINVGPWIVTEKEQAEQVEEEQEVEKEEG